MATVLVGTDTQRCFAKLHICASKGLAFLIAVFGYTIFGYVTATFATFFIGRDAEEKDAPLAGAKDVEELKAAIKKLTASIDQLKSS